MKKFLALILAGSMLFTMPVLAAGSPSASTVKPKPKPSGTPTVSGNSCKPKSETSASDMVSAVEASSVSAAVAAAAAAEGKSIGEYLNNAVVTVPGLDNVVPIGQGGHVIINGAPSNQVFSVLKPARENVSSAKLFAAGLRGKILNVVRINASISGFRTAQVNFYMKGVTAGQNIKVFQIVNGRWLEVDVIEIREDHVVVEMTSLGTLAFIEMPSK